MPQHHDVPFNVTGGSLYLDCREGRPSSVTSVQVFAWDVGDDGSAESATTGSASVDSVNTTFDANSGVSSSNTRLLNLTATSNLVIGREYLATTADGEYEWLDIMAITSGASATSRAPMYNDYVSGDTLVGTRISISLADAWVQDEGNVSDGTLHHPGYRVRWEYIVGGTTYVRASYFDLTRIPAGHRVTASSIERLMPGFVNALPRDHQEDQARAFIDECYRQFRLDLYQERIDDAAVRDADVIDEMVMRKALHLWAEQRVQIGGGDAEAADRAKGDYWARFTSMFKAPTIAKAPIATGSDGAGSYQAPARITVR